MIWVRRTLETRVPYISHSLAAQIMVLWKELEPFYTQPSGAKAQQAVYV